MKRTLLGIPVFGVMVLVLLGALQFAGWLPSIIDSGSLRKYGSVEELRSRLQMRPLLVPVYYPRTVNWPPSLVAGQMRPYPASAMVFAGRQAAGTVMTVTQTDGGRPPLIDQMKFITTRETVSTEFKQRRATLEAGSCRESTLCSRVSWQEGPYHIVVTAALPPAELMSVAESMIAGRGVPGIGTISRAPR